MPIDPERLHHLREARKLSRAQLARRAKVSERTIQRWESDSERSQTPRAHTMKCLAGALGVEEGVLTSELPLPDSGEPAAPEPDGVRISAEIDPMARLAYDLIKRRYGVSATEIIDMAPLFFVLLAEGSLAWRRERMKEAHEAIALLDRVEDSTGNKHFRVRAFETGETVDLEENSIGKADLFGEGLFEKFGLVPFDPDKTNPFAHFLRKLAGDLEKPDVVDMDRDFLAYGSPPRFPYYWICRGDLRTIANRFAEAEDALMRGDVRLHEIPEELMAEDKGEARAKWLADRAPPPLTPEDIEELLSGIDDRSDSESGERGDDR